MLLSLLVVVLIGIVAYFHYLQGLFGSALSAMFAVIAALLAVGYHEVLVDALLGGKLADYAHAIGLVVIFAVVYLVLRVISDQFVSGNVQYSLWVDRIGGGVMGVIAGLSGVGVLAIAAQALPLGARIAMHERYPIEWGREATMRVVGSYTPQSALYDQLDAEKFVNNEATGMWVAADELVLSLAARVSGDAGSLSTGRAWNSVHPDYLQELFGQRVGIQPGGKQTAMAESVQVAGLYTAESFSQDDQERWEKDDQGVGTRHSKSDKPPAELPAVLKPAPEHLLLVVRATIASSAMDEKNTLVGFSPASARLVLKRKGENQYQNFYPVGTLENGQVVFRNAPDDYLFLPGDKAVDFVYELPLADATEPRTDKTAPMKLAAGTLFEFKRMARVDLSGKEIKPGVADAKDVVEVVRKQGMNMKLAASSAKSNNAPLSIEGQPDMSDKLFTAINVGTPDRNGKGEQDWGTFQLKDGKFTKVELKPVRTIRVMAQGPTENMVQAFGASGDMAIVQVSARPSTRVADKWAWADTVGDFELVDSSGTRTKPLGVVVKVNNSNGQEMLLIEYDSQKPLTSISAEQQMRPTDIKLLYAINLNSQVKLLEYKRQVVQLIKLEIK